MILQATLDFIWFTTKKEEVALNPHTKKNDKIESFLKQYSMLGIIVISYLVRKIKNLNHVHLPSLRVLFWLETHSSLFYNSFSFTTTHSLFGQDNTVIAIHSTASKVIQSTIEVSLLVSQFYFRLFVLYFWCNLSRHVERFRSKYIFLFYLLWIQLTN